MPAEFADLLQRIDHVGVAVADLDATIAFYAGVLGLRVLHREENPEQGVVEVMLTASTNDQNATELQILAPLTNTSAIAKFVTNRGPGLHHVAYRVADLDRASALFHERGVQLLYPRGATGTRHSKINFMHPKDTGGVLIELVEHPTKIDSPRSGSSSAAR